MFTEPPPSPPPAAISTTLEALRVHPGAFEGKRLRLRGQVTQCSNYTCDLCPIDATRSAPQLDQCVGLAFDPVRGDGRAGYTSDPAYRFADVVLVATFNGACLQPFSCTDRGTVLSDAQVERVTRRRSSRDGIWVFPATPLIDAPVADAEALMAIARTETSNAEHSIFRAFAAKDDPTMQRRGVVCRISSYPSSPPVSWPSNVEEAISERSTEDHWSCWSAVRADGAWIVTR